MRGQQQQRADGGVTPADFGGDGPLAGVEFQRKWERRAFELGGGGFRAPGSGWGTFGAAADDAMGRRGTAICRATPANLWDCLPEKVCEGIKESLAEFNKRIKDFSHPDALDRGGDVEFVARPDDARRGAAEQPAGLYPWARGGLRRRNHVVRRGRASRGGSDPRGGGNKGDFNNMTDCCEKKLGILGPLFDAWIFFGHGGSGPGISWEGSRRSSIVFRRGRRTCPSRWA